MVISSLVVEARPALAVRAAEAIAGMPRAEVHGVDEETGRIVVSVEARSIDESHAVASGFLSVEGVFAASLIYADFEDEQASPSCGR